MDTVNKEENCRDSYGKNSEQKKTAQNSYRNAKNTSGKNQTSDKTSNSSGSTNRNEQ